MRRGAKPDAPGLAKIVEISRFTEICRDPSPQNFPRCQNLPRKKAAHLLRLSGNARMGPAEPAGPAAAASSRPPPAPRAGAPRASREISHRGLIQGGCCRTMMKPGASPKQVRRQRPVGVGPARAARPGRPGPAVRPVVPARAGRPGRGCRPGWVALARSAAIEAGPEPGQASPPSGDLRDTLCRKPV